MKEKLHPDVRILTDCAAHDKESLFSILAAECATMRFAHEMKLSGSEILAELWMREKESSTEMDAGLIFPHARLGGLRGLTVVFAMLRNPFQTEHGKEIRLACMMLIPQEAPMEALKFLSRVADCVRDAECDEKLCRFLVAGDLRNVENLLDLEAKKILCAGDLIREPRCTLTSEMPLKTATKLMLAKDAQFVPVLENGHLAGELSCETLFKLGIPDFFTHLKSVGFLRCFDPFEKYFALEARSTVGDAMTRDIRRFSPDDTLIEIVFAMVVEKVPLIYVTDANGILLGVIDRAVLLERIINL